MVFCCFFLVVQIWTKFQNLNKYEIWKSSNFEQIQNLDRFENWTNLKVEAISVEIRNLFRFEHIRNLSKIWNLFLF
jgi:hypothetical protein